MFSISGFYFLFHRSHSVVCLRSSFMLSHYYRLSVSLFRFRSVDVGCRCCCHFPIHSMKPKTYDKKSKKKASSITYSTRPLQHQLGFWHATLINLSNHWNTTPPHLLMYFRCAIWRARALVSALLYLCLLFVAKRLLMKVNVHLYCWYMRASARAPFSWHIWFVYLCFFKA